MGAYMTGSDIEQAVKDWITNRAYLDNNGNYHVKREGHTKGPIAKWNKSVKRVFKDVTEFHNFVHIGYVLVSELSKGDIVEIAKDGMTYQWVAGAIFAFDKLRRFTCTSTDDIAIINTKMMVKKVS